jgi:hypothetical protein
VRRAPSGDLDDIAAEAYGSGGDPGLQEDERGGRNVDEATRARDVSFESSRRAGSTLVRAVWLAGQVCALTGA